jgi:DNA-binding Lrp family transcriptional regulator
VHVISAKIILNYYPIKLNGVSTLKKIFFGKQDSTSMNPQDLRVLFSLIAKSNKSDRAMAKVLGISNASLSKRRKKLENEGYIKEYTIIPDLHRMGIELVIFHFATTSDVYTSAQVEAAREFFKKYPGVLGLFEERSHRGTSWFAITVHRNYEDFMEMSKKINEDILSSDPKNAQLDSHYERHTFLFHTDKPSPIPFSFKNLELLFQSTK